MNITRMLGIAAITATVGSLTACAYPGQLEPGTTVGHALSTYGRPAVEQPLAGGGTRLIWTTQPLGQYAWRADADAAGTIQRVTQVLSTNEFARLAEGSWNKSRLLAEFGPPAEVSRVGVTTSTEVWSWRYKDMDVFPALMHAYFSPDGQMTRFHKGPDPMFDVNDRDGRR